MMIVKTGGPRSLTSQLSVDQWHVCLDEPTLADAILDRLVRNSYGLNLKGGLMRKHRRSAAAGQASATTAI